jgi:hypothetical protein
VNGPAAAQDDVGLAAVADRYRRATYRLAVAAREVKALTEVLTRSKQRTAAAAAQDLAEAIAILVELPSVTKGVIHRGRHSKLDG